MIRAGFDTTDFVTTINNIASYSHGFTRGINYARVGFNRELSVFVEEALKKYIDARARANPESLHHVYEWGMTGSPAGRLFEFTSTVSQSFINFSGKFLPSTVPSETSTEPFIDKAMIMEKQISITIDPENSEFLVFEDDGELVFSSGSVTIDTPGGAAVGGSFVEAVSDFFNNYLTVGLLKSSGIFDKLKYAKEYSRRFSQGAKSGSSAGFLAGKEYLSLGGITVE